MNKQIKKVALYIIAFILVISPIVAFAQFGFPSTGGGTPAPGIPGPVPTQAGGYGGTTSTSTIQGIIYNAMQWALSILAALGVIGFVIAGIMYLLSGGDDGRMKTAKNAMVAAIIGVVVGIMGLVIMYAARNFLMGSSPNF